MITRIQKATEQMKNEIASINKFQTYSPISCHALRNFGIKLREELQAQALTRDVAKEAILALRAVASRIDMPTMVMCANELNHLYHDRY